MQNKQSTFIYLSYIGVYRISNHDEYIAFTEKTQFIMI